MLRDGVAVGSIGVSRPMRGGYTDAEVSILQTFANQAAIAVENARLLREVEQRNRELAESLDLQTATSEILALISANPGDLRKVFDGIVSLAARLCDADGAGINVIEGDSALLVASSHQDHQHLIGQHRTALPAGLDLSATHFADDLSAVFPTSMLRSTVNVPLLVQRKDLRIPNRNRMEVRPFEPRHGRIAEMFAEQAAIAIGNAKLFNDLDESLARQRAMT